MLFPSIYRQAWQKIFRDKVWGKSKFTTCFWLSSISMGTYHQIFFYFFYLNHYFLFKWCLKDSRELGKWKLLNPPQAHCITSWEFTPLPSANEMLLAALSLYIPRLPLFPTSTAVFFLFFFFSVCFAGCDWHVALSVGVPISQESRTLQVATF